MGQFFLPFIYLLICIFLQSLVETTPSTTTTSTTTEYFTTMRKHYFEGVDWQMHPQANRRQQDCYGYYIRCIRRTTPLIPLCGFNIATWYLEDYYNICEIGIENCFHRLKKKTGVFGGEWWTNLVYHNGERYDCHEAFRRAQTPEELDLFYFGGDKNEVLAAWEKGNYERYYGPNPTDQDDEMFDGF